ncbi:phasin family protein [Polynucleobacter sp. es-MAR-4]|uniref:phasin family protein n=1 Tax=Polynucleobacter sp. es-MAR-4 TaxID=1855655 RepID=UPI001C0CAD49|nr:phasin family protein [Polynucleobacter sp. es-MAR-4]MBU3637504.1 phasin family protein [Polynucleobacter sp. es-MAR-4]
MSKNPFDLGAMANQAKGMKAAQAVGQAALTSAQEIAQLNQRAAQELSTRLQAKVAELMKTQDPKAAFDYVHAEVLQDAAKEVAEYQAQLFQALASGNKELAKIAESMIKDSQHDLIHFVNEATQNAPAGTEPYTSVFKTSFNNALQNFELIRAAMADSFVNFEKSVENMSQFSAVQKNNATQKPKKKSG